MFLRLFLFFVLALLVVRAVGRFFGGVAQASRSGAPRATPADAAVRMTKDPVCGTFVVPGKALSVTSGDSTVYFCSEECRASYARRG